MSNRKETRMAQIPYGYRIERGRIAVDTEAAAEISRFVESYLSGLSVKESKKASEISLITDTEKEDGSLSYVLTVTNRIRKTVRFLKVDHIEFSLDPATSEGKGCHRKQYDHFYDQCDPLSSDPFFSFR